MKIKKKMDVKIKINPKEKDKCKINCRFYHHNPPFRDSCSLFNKWTIGLERCQKCIDTFGEGEE